LEAEGELIMSEEGKKSGFGMNAGKGAGREDTLGKEKSLPPKGRLGKLYPERDEKVCCSSTKGGKVLVASGMQRKKSIRRPVKNSPPVV